MGEVITIGLDIAKSVFQVHGVDEAGAVMLRKRIGRAKMLEFFGKLTPCLVGIEACPAAHHWGRELQALGHTVRLMPPSYVKAYLKRSKNDANDAAAICEAVTRPTMRFVPIKTKDQQAALTPHRGSPTSGASAHDVEQRPPRASGRIRHRVGERPQWNRRFARDHCRRRRTAVFLRWPAGSSRCAGAAVRRPGSRDRVDRQKVSWLGTARARRAGGWRRFQASVQSSPLPWLPRSATGRRSGRGAAWLRGLGWCRSSSRPAARTSSVASPNRATDTCDGCWLPARWPSSAMHRSTAR